MAQTPSKHLAPKSAEISGLFKSSFFEVPKNQRDYRWSNEQRLKLWDDLVATVKYDSNPENQNQMGHFLGQIVVIGPEQSMDTNRLQVIDGQQRLTSITILAECLRIFSEDIEDKKDRVRSIHILSDCIAAPDKDYAARITLDHEHDFYYNSLVNFDSFDAKKEYWDKEYSESSEVQKNIYNAFNQYFELIGGYLADTDSQKEKDEKLIELVNIMTNNLYFLVVRVENSMMVYRLFETLNERGLDLTQADLIKNVLLESARPQGEDQMKLVASCWREFAKAYEEQPNVNKLDLPHLIQFSYTYRHFFVKKEDIFDKISKDLRNGDVDALELGQEFERDAKNWSKFLSGDLRNWTETQADAQYAIVEPLWKKHCAPFILAIMDKYSTNYGILERLVVLCEHYLFRQGLVCKDSVTILQKVFGEAARLIRTNAEVDAVAEHFRVNSNDDIFVECFKSVSMNNMKQGFYALWKIENYLFEGDEIGFKPNSQSAAQHLEHIMPRTLGQGWEHLEGREELAVYSNRLGNFMVLGGQINQSIKNMSIEHKMNNDKENDYSHSKLKLVEEFLEKFNDWSDHELWTFDSISRRQEHLADKYAIRVWSLM